MCAIRELHQEGVLTRCEHDVSLGLPCPEMKVGFVVDHRHTKLNTFAVDDDVVVPRSGFKLTRRPNLRSLHLHLDVHRDLSINQRTRNRRAVLQVSKRHRRVLQANRFGDTRLGRVVMFSRLSGGLFGRLFTATRHQQTQDTR